MPHQLPAACFATILLAATVTAARTPVPVPTPASGSPDASLAGAAARLVGLPIVSGETGARGLPGPVAIARDARSMPRIDAASLASAFYALGYVHAQDRLFQMDTLRRLPTGRLAALVGSMGVAMDASNRTLGFDRVAQAVLGDLSPDRRALLDAYTAGVNQGIGDTPGLPPEYIVLGGVRPEPWDAADSVAIVLFMFISLSSDYDFEFAIAAMQDSLPAELAAFLLPLRQRFDAAMTGRDWNRADALPVPGADVVDWRDLNPARFGPDRENAWPIDSVPIEDTLGLTRGSNAWAVSGARSAHGGALLASDMHQPLTAPNVWYPVELAWGGGGFERSGREHTGPREYDTSPAKGQAVGLTLPGVPGLIAGSNGAVAWGATNLIADVYDRVVVEQHPADRARYRVPASGDEHASAWEAFDVRIETVDVRGGSPVRVPVATSRWGPIVRSARTGELHAVKWTALDPDAVNFDSIDLLFAGTLDDAARIAARAKGPPLNMVLVDADGRAGWVVSGYIPRRTGFDRSRPTNWASADGAPHAWLGDIELDDRPMLLDPPSGRVFSSNNRGGSVDAFAPIGTVFAPPRRAWRVRQMLDLPDAAFTERDFLAMQYDVRAVELDFFREALRVAFEAQPPREGRIRRVLETALRWDGFADADSTAYRFIRAFRHRLLREILGELLEPVLNTDPAFTIWPVTDEPLRRIIEDRPAHLIPPPHDDFDAYLRAAFARAVNDVALETDAFGAPLPLSAPWGEANRLAMLHPLAAGVPDWLLGPIGFLNMPAHQQAGDVGTVRVARPTFGSSCQLVVSPGREHLGILTIPAGVSGNPLSPHYRDRHPAWANARAEPLLAGPPRAVLRLRPE